MELKTYKQKVRKILEEHESARNNDGSLWAYYIIEYHKNLVTKDLDGNPAIPLKYLKELPANQSLRLARQLIQNTDGELLPTDPKVAKARGIKEKSIREVEWREAKMS